MRSERQALLAPLLACFVALAAVLVPYLRYRPEIGEFDRFHLPAFDPYVYVAMAEHPTVFTVAPWGYRVLTPWAVHLLGQRNLVAGFRLLTVGGLALAGVLLFLFLRAIGHSIGRSLAATAVFGLSPPVSQCVRSVFLNEPLCVGLEIAFLLGVETGASLPLLCLLLTLMAASKEIWLLLLPVVYVASEGTRRHRALVTLAAGAPPLLVTLILRWWWAPQVHPARPGLEAALALVVARFRVDWPETWPGLVLDGVTPLALLGLLHPAGRAFARRYLVLALALSALALVAWLNVPANYVVPFFGANTTRLMIYVLPLLLPMMLFALDRVLPSWHPPRIAPRPRLAAAATAGVVLFVAFLPAGLDRYRRLPLHEHRDGPLVLTLCRETLRTARRLESGRPVVFDLGEDGAGEAGPRPMTDIRWFLRDGWDGGGPYSTRPVRTIAGEASIILPCFQPRPLAVTLDLEAAPEAVLDVVVNGRALGRWRDGAAMVVPAAFLFRGDNLVTLRGKPGQARLRALSYAPVDAAASGVSPRERHGGGGEAAAGEGEGEGEGAAPAAPGSISAAMRR